MVNLSQDFAGLGGDSHYLRTAVDGRFYRPLGGDYVGMLRAQGGYVVSRLKLSKHETSPNPRWDGSRELFLTQFRNLSHVF